LRTGNVSQINISFDHLLERFFLVVTRSHRSPRAPNGSPRQVPSYTTRMFSQLREAECIVNLPRLIFFFAVVTDFSPEPKFVAKGAARVKDLRSRFHTKQTADQESDDAGRQKSR
jgi:hypothetical protein